MPFVFIAELSQKQYDRGEQTLSCIVEKSVGRANCIVRFCVVRKGKITVTSDDRQTAYDCGRTQIYAKRSIYRNENRNTPDDFKAEIVL